MTDIELVIKIPDRVHGIIKCFESVLDSEYKEDDDVKTILIKSILKSVPLPKGHGKLKDADKIISGICGSSCGCHLEECGHDSPCYPVAMISSASTIIEADKAESEE